MKRHVIIAPEADRDIDEQCVHIAQGSMEAAHRFLVAVECAIDEIAEMPEVGRKWELSRPALRSIRVWHVRKFTNHLIFYRVTDEGIEIVRVLHAARDIDAVFKE